MPKRIQPLTAKGLDAVRPREGEVVELGDGLLPGLRVRVSVGGRFWSLNIRNTKRRTTPVRCRRQSDPCRGEAARGNTETGDQAG